MQNDLDLNKNKNAIVLEHVSKLYPETESPALVGISLAVKPAEFVCIIGPSGCGKSTLVKIIARLERATTGTVELPQKVGLVFQSGALLPWLTVEDNAAFGLRAEHAAEATVRERVKKYLAMVGLEAFAKKYPHELSGGQRQRVGIARALAPEPQVLLLDEPFSALDPKTTEELHKDILAIWRETKITIVIVSHLIEEAVSLGERVVLMKNGKIEEIYPINLPYPRRESGIAFHDTVQKIRAKFFA
ncbi:MAG: ABC transporter ATP-binding protein [Minisyncoccia bacterium]|jgi:ABC-type nitrate/sulfonate/bicarbonate transport system ATPase subunit